MKAILARDGIPTTTSGNAWSAPRIGRAPRLPATLLGACLALPMAAPADDLDVYRAALEAQKRPNVLFVLDYSGSMGRDLAGNEAATSGQPARIDILKRAVRTVINDNLDVANFGIGSLYKTDASGVRWPTVPARDEANTLDPDIPAGITNRDVIFAELDRLPASGGTATVHALAEASAYFRGEQVNEVPGRTADTWDASTSRYARGDARAALPASFTGEGSAARYATPVQTCQANAVILVSDGQPTVLRDDDRVRDALGGAPPGSCEELSGSIFAPGTDSSKGNCGPEIARRLATPGSIPGHPKAVVSTYTIGFAIGGEGSDYLQKVAAAGGGSTARADDLDTLTTALGTLLGQIAASNQSFAAVSVDVDRASFSHRERAYFNLFEPSRSNAWRGNLKGYFLTTDGLRSLDGTPATTTRDGRQVFKETAQSFWSKDLDGDEVLAGGASEGLGIARNLYTYLGPRASGTPIDLAGDPVHALASSNAALGAAGLGLPGDATARSALIDALHAAPLGDPLHTQAVGLDYPGRQVMFTMTNQGFIHAFDATRPVGTAATGSTDTGGGEELWAFMPGRLLANLPKQFPGATDGDHVYGLDGGITRWHDDDDRDGLVDPGERMLLVFGMRRGGTSYYALDVSDPLEPKLVWEIDPAVAGFERLGESWSTPALVSAASSATTEGRERFLVFGGGYDAATLDERNEPTASRGNALYVVDARGRLAWSTDGRDQAAMRYAMPSDPTVIDSDGDGLADRLYIGDLGGQVWRVDFDDMRNAAEFRTTRLAMLADGSHQPFFYPPSVSYHRGEGDEFLSVTLGSGNRPDPMRRDSDNAFFMLRDVDVKRGPPASATTTIQAYDLYDATENARGSTDERTATRAATRLAAARGWRIDLRPGEKALSAPLGFEGRLLATTFEPGGTIAPGACSPEPIGRYYQMDIRTGQPLSADGTPVSDPGARMNRLINTGGIPSSPMVMFPKGAASVAVMVDKQTVGTLAQGLSRVFWHAR